MVRPRPATVQLAHIRSILWHVLMAVGLLSRQVVPQANREAIGTPVSEQVHECTLYLPIQLHFPQFAF